VVEPAWLHFQEQYNCKVDINLKIFKFCGMLGHVDVSKERSTFLFKVRLV
jgi:hypothetical protein